jgi:hypothetical protein
VNGSVTRTYADGLQRISEDQLLNGSWVPGFHGYDGHGNVRFRESFRHGDGHVHVRCLRRANPSTGTTSNPYLYSGERFDGNLNLYYPLLKSRTLAVNWCSSVLRVLAGACSAPRAPSDRGGLGGSSGLCSDRSELLE